MKNLEISQLAVEKLKKAIKIKNKKDILEAYELIENETFEWNSVSRDLYLIWDELINEANDILYS